MEKYSVLMSVYKNEKAEYFRVAMDSMINQTVRPDEIVLVEDGPLTNELYSVIDEYKMKFPEFFNIVINEQNLGLGRALNRGLAVCKNELVARMDTDDISLPDRCERQLHEFERNLELDIVGGDISEFTDDPSQIVAYRRVPESNEEIREYIKTRCPLNHVTVMFKKTSVQRAGGYLDCFWNEDYYLWIRMYLDGAVFMNTGTVAVNVRVGRDMYNRRGGKKYFESEKCLQQYMLENEIITKSLYRKNVMKRWIVQRLLPNSLRGWVFRTFARKDK